MYMPEEEQYQLALKNYIAGVRADDKIRDAALGVTQTYTGEEEADYDKALKYLFDSRLEDIRGMGKMEKFFKVSILAFLVCLIGSKILGFI